MADGAFYNDLRSPFIMTDVASVTLAATNKALVPVSNLPIFGGQYWWVGKKVRYRLFGRMTTALTPGNGTFAVLFGTGADANGVSLAATAAHALTASQTNLSWMAEFFVHCRSYGSTGTLFCTGYIKYNESLVAAMQFLPASAPAVSGSVDLTSASLVISPQYLRSGSTAETMQVHDLEVVALN